MSEDTNTGSTPVHQSRNCSTCKTGIEMADDIFLCVCCGKVMHSSVQCTGLPEDAIAGIQLISLNVLLLCNYCVERNRRDVILNDLASNRSSDASALFFDTVVERVDVIKKIVTETAEKLFATSQAEYPPLCTSAVTTVAPPHATSPLMSTDTGIRVRGIPEVDKPNHHERYKNDMEEARKLLQFLLGSNADIADIRRLGKFEKNRRRPLLVKFSNAWQPRLALLSRSKLKDYKNQKFIDKELSPAEIQSENTLLLKRRELIGQGTERKSLRIRDLSLEQKIDNRWSVVEST